MVQNVLQFDLEVAAPEGDVMRIDHVAIWTADLERLKGFYVCYFGALAGPKYENPGRQFTSYSLGFPAGCRLELMHVPGLLPRPEALHTSAIGYAHISVSVGSEQEVDSLTARLRDDGFPVVDGPRRTGDDFYESAVLDPDGNRIEISA
jgi:lactoylglutathione lyase